MEYRLVVGEKGNEQGHIIPSGAKSASGARIALGRALARYGGDGWGRIEKNECGSALNAADKWRPLRECVEYDSKKK